MAKGYIATTGTIGGIAGTLCLLGVLVTTPLSIGPLGVTAWFISLLVALTSALALASYLVARKLSNTSPSTSAAWRRGLFIGGYITILLALSSLKQLNLRDAVLLAILLALTEFYMVMKR